VNLEDFEVICKNICKIPKIFKKSLFDRIKKVGGLDENAEKIPKQNFVNYWKTEYEMESVSKRVFKLLAQPNTKYIVPDDFKSLFKYLLESHPGLEFL
jgi:hypothetical protein